MDITLDITEENMKIKFILEALPSSSKGAFERMVGIHPATNKEKITLSFLFKLLSADCSVDTVIPLTAVDILNEAITSNSEDQRLQKCHELLKLCDLNFRGFPVNAQKPSQQVV